MVGGSLWVLRFLPPLKTGRHDIAEILLKVTVTPPPPKKNQIKEGEDCGTIFSNIPVTSSISVQSKNHNLNLDS